MSSKEFEESKERMKKLFRENPELRKAFKETLDELSKPENIRKMSEDICSVLNKVNELRKGNTNAVLDDKSQRDV